VVEEFYGTGKSKVHNSSDEKETLKGAKSAHGTSMSRGNYGNADGSQPFN